MTTSIAPHIPFTPDRPIEVTLGFGIGDAGDDDWSSPAEERIGLFARFVIAGGFVESCPKLGWQASVAGSIIRVVFDRLPADRSALPLLVRMLLALPRPPVTVQLRGTPAASSPRALPSTAASLGLLPRMRSQLVFALEMEPGGTWINLDVSCRGVLDVAAAQLMDERLELWCAVCRAGGFSEIEPDSSVRPGSAGKYDPAVGVDFFSAEVAYDSVELSAPGALVNLLDEIARSGVPIDGVSML